MRRKSLLRKMTSSVLAATMSISLLGSAGLSIVAEAAEIEEGKEVLSDGTFPSTFWDDGIWSMVAAWDGLSSAEIFSYADDEWMKPGDNQEETALKFWFEGAENDVLVYQTVDLAAGEYTISGDAMGSGMDIYTFISDAEGNVIGTSGQAWLSGYNTWDGYESIIEVEEDIEGAMVGFHIDGSEGGWGYLDSLSLVCNELYGSEKTEFTLYYYYEGEETLYMNIWSHSGIDFASTTDTSWDFGWSNAQGLFTPVADHENWYSIDISILDATDTSEGFDIYAGSSDNQIIGVSQQWAYTDVYATLTSGAKSSYYLKNGELQKTFEVEDDSEDEYTLADLIELYEEVGGLTNDDGALDPARFAAYLVAEEKAKAVIDAESTDTAVITEVYNNLINAVLDLRYISSINVERIDDIEEDTIRGIDVSSFVSIMDAFDILNAEAGTTKYGFKDYDGNILSRQGFFNFLSENGVNYIRVRVWLNPYDSNNNGYGGGNNDLAKAVEIGKYATNANMKVLVDFHYSDFWCDPGKQPAPRAWSGYTVAEKADAIYDYTKSSIQTMLSAGVDVGMVQVGNETNGAMAGVTGSGNWTSNLDLLFDAGCDAVHDVAAENGKTILAAVHFTNPESSGKQTGYASNLAAGDVSYDVFATSYYPYWHGSLSNLTSVLTQIATTYDKKVMVAETSWAYTLDDIDGHENTVRVGNNDTGANNNWLFTVQGQASEFRDVLNAVVNVKNDEGDVLGLGAFYWEGAWIAVQNVYDEDGNIDSSLLAKNKELWEATGSGWASSYAAEFDPSDAGKWYGGSAVDNQAFFDKDGVALQSLKVFNYENLAVGTVAEKTIDGYSVEELTIEIGTELTADMLGGASVIYNDGTSDDVAVNWSAEDIASVNENGVGTYKVNGVLDSDSTFEVETTVTVVPSNLLENPGFENALTTDDWIISNLASRTKDDPYAGTYSVHWYNSSAGTFDVTQTVEVTENGTYKGYIYAQGADGDKIKVTLSANDISNESDTKTLSGWKNWAVPTAAIVVTGASESTPVTITYTITVDYTAGGWGTMDNAFLYLESAEEEAGEKTAELAGATLTLNGNIGVNLYMDLSEAAVNDTAGKLVLQVPSTGSYITKEVDISEAIETTVSGKTYYVFGAEVAAKEMTSDIIAQYVFSDGTKSDEYTYSIQTYANTMFDKSANYSDAAITLVKKMLNYGAASQEYFEYNLSNLANSILSDEDKVITENPDFTAFAADIDTENAVSGVSYVGSSLILKSGTEMRHYFTFDNVDISELEIYVNDVKADSSILVKSGSKYYIQIDSVAANKLGTGAKISVGGVVVSNYSVLTYCEKAVNSSNFYLAKVAKTLYDYYNASLGYN